MAKLFNGMINFASAIKPTGAQPLDDRTVVQSFADLLADETFGLAKYNGMLVAVVDDEQVYMLIDDKNSANEDSWVAVGSGNGSLAVETYAEAVALATSDNIGQVIYVKTKSSYDADGEGEGAAVEYDAAPYIVIGDKSLMKLAASTASGDVTSDVAELQTKVSDIESTVGDAEGGLVKDVADLRKDVDAIVIPEVPVQDVQVNDVSVLGEDGVAKIQIDLTPYETIANVDAVRERVGKNETDIAALNEQVSGNTAEIAKKVDKVEGERLMTDAEGAKLAGIAEGAQVNVIEKVKVNGVELTVAEADKSVDVIVPTAPVQGVADGEKVISLDGDKLKTTLTLAYVPADGEQTAVLRLQGINGEVVSSIDATAFVKDGMLDGAKLEGPAEGETGEKYLVLTFNTAAGKEDIRMDVTDLLDYYSAGDGLVLDGKTFKVKVDETANSYLQVTTNGIAVSQAFIDKITEFDNAVLASAKAYADTVAASAKTEAIASANAYADGLAVNYDAKGAAEQALADAKGYADGLNTAMNTRVAALESINHEEFAKAADVYAKTEADATFVKQEGFNEFTTEMETKLEGIAEGAQVNVIEKVVVNGIEAAVENKQATVTVDADEINLGTAIKNGEEVKYAEDTKISVVLQGIQDSIRGAIAGGVNSVAAGDTAIVVNSADANNPVVSLNVETSDENTVSQGHIEMVKGNDGLYGVMYYDGDDAE